MIDDITQIMSKYFGFPCKEENIKIEIHNNAIEWCETQCGKATAAECWKKFFELKLEE